MTSNLFTRARIVGLAIVAGAFALGVAAGMVFSARPVPGVIMTVTTTDAIPKEIEALGLSDEQRTAVRNALRAGRPRVSEVMREMQTRMAAALKATEDEIERSLTPSQVDRWREYRRRNPPKTEQRFIKR
jgi:uncharacterized membrane protein